MRIASRTGVHAALLRPLVLAFALLAALVSGAAVASDPLRAAGGVDFGDMHAMLGLASALHTYRAPAGSAPDGSTWYVLTAVNQAERPAARVLFADEPPGAGLRVFPLRGRPALLQVASSDAGVTVDSARAFGRHAFLVTIPPATSATLAVRVVNAEAPPSVVAWTVPALVLHNKQLAIFLAAVAGLIAASVAITAGVAVMTRHQASRWAVIVLGAVLVVELNRGGMFESGWIGTLGGPYGFAAMLAGLTLAAGIRLADSVAPVDEVWPRGTAVLTWCLRGLLALAVLAFVGVPGAALLMQSAVVAGTAIIAGYLVHRGMLGARAARVVAPSAAVFSLVTLATAVVALGGFQDNPAAPAIIGGFAAAGAVLLALAISAGEGVAILSAEHTVPVFRVTPPPIVHHAAPPPANNAALQAIGASHQGVFDLDFLNETVRLSAEAAQLIGMRDGGKTFPHEEWVGRIHADDRETYLRAMQDYRDHPGLAFRIEFRVRSESGRYPWFELRATMIGEGQMATRCLGLMADVTTRKEFEAAANDKALHDPLTGLGNRVALMEALEQLGEGIHDAAYALLDIDRFKSIHASLGDAGGDEVLMRVAERLKRKFANIASVFRVGGDAFAVLAPNAWHRASAIGGELVAICAQPFPHGGRDVFAPASAGAVSGRDADDVRDLLRNAELALAQAKRQGGCCSRLYMREMESYAPADTVALEAELRRALDEKQFDLYYQPIIQLSDGRVVGFEALLRWRHPTRGVLLPEEFIPHAEKTGLIVPIGRFALEGAARDLADWQHYFPVDPPLYVSVNVSRRQFQDEQFEATLKSVIERNELMPRALKLEITESALATNEVAASALARARALGFGIAIDDFGTGHSALAQLKDIPFDIIKIDKSFLSAVGPGGEDGAIILASMIALGRDLNRDVVAEGIETEEEAAKVKAMGCGFAQGYHFSTALSATDAIGFIARHYGAERKFGQSYSGAAGGS